MLPIKLMVEYTKDLNVLYVEDDVVLAKSTLSLLENYFKNIDVAYDGQEGFDQYNAFYQSNDDYYDLIITDINMPNMNGIEMCKHIYKKNDMQSIIITTAHNESAFLQQSIELGIDSFITKPINNKYLIKTLYKTCQSISDRKLIETHLEMIESLNATLEEKNTQLQKQNLELKDKNTALEKSFRMLDTMVNKEQMIHTNVAIDETTDESNDRYLQEQIEHLINDDLYELREIHSEIDVDLICLLNNTQNIDANAFSRLISQFEKYASLLAIYNFFDDLSGSMKDFTYALKENPLPEDIESIENIFMLVESFLYVLGKWQDTLQTGNPNSINSLDASMISDMKTIINLWIPSEENFSEDDLDDIFDF